VIEFTFFWKAAGRWGGTNYSVAVTGQSQRALGPRNDPKNKVPVTRVRKNR
jgi:hypothetical protein